MKIKFLIPVSTLATLFIACSSSLFALEFTPLELEKANWESRQLTSYDINGDGLKDLAYIDGIERSIDLLIQKKSVELSAAKPKENAPPLKRTRFSQERISTEAPASSFVLGDFSGKGKVELAYTAKKQGIVFMERDASGHWTQSHRIPDVEVLGFTHVLWAGHLSQADKLPGRPMELVALVKGKLLIIRDYKIVASYGTLYENSGFINLSDTNGDGRLDIFYDYESPRGMACRVQDVNGRFDSEQILSYAPESEKNFGYRGDNVYFFGGSTPFVEERKITATALKPLIRYYGCYPDSAQGVLANFEGKTEPSLVIADSKGSELIMYRNSILGWVSPERFPSLKSVSALVGLIGSKGPALALFSPDEHAVAVTSWDTKAKRIAFPQIVEIADEPVNLFGVSGRAWVLSRTDRDFYLQQIFADGAVGEKTKLDALKRAPDSVVALDEKGSTLIAFLQSRDVSTFYSVSASGAVAQVKPSGALSRANFASLEPNRVGRGTLPGDSADALIIAQKSTLRIFKYEKGQLELADQVSALNADASLRLPFVKDGVLWAYDTKSSNYLKFERNAERLWKNTGQIDGGVTDPQSIIQTTEGWLTFGRRAFYTLNPAASGVTLTASKRWESALDIDGYNWGSLEYFDSKTPLAVLYNQPKKVLEVVEMGETPKSLLNFEVYKQDAHYSGRTGEEIEPRELISADVTGDGKADLVMLIHNKILVYPQR